MDSLASSPPSSLLKGAVNQCKSSLKQLIRGNHISCYVLSESPLILVSYFKDFCDNLAVIKAYAEKKNQPVYALFQLGYHVETDWRVDEIRAGLAKVRQALPDAQLTFLTNSEKEAQNIKPLGVSAFFCHQNAFIDHRRYPLVRSRKQYDAIYLARFTPAKRHELATEVRSMLLIGDHMAAEESYFQQSIKALSHADRLKKIYAFQVSRTMAKARVGLALSAEEGAMFVAGEYLLAGIPVVSTQNMGGRHYLMPAEYLEIVEDCPHAVAEGVTKLAAANFKPEQIRDETIKLMQAHQQALREYLTAIRKVHNAPAYTEPFPHKLALRCRVPLTLRGRMVKPV